MKKQLKKQKEVVRNIKNAIRGDNKRVRNGTVLESAINRLTGMSIGRVQMWNHGMIEHEMCWANGFRMLNSNPFLKKQLKQLDKNRNHQIALLKKSVAKYSDDDLEDGEIDKPQRKLVYYGKPYSYYYHVTKKDNT